VLDDLPPKIIQDYHCDLSPLQKIFYDEHAKSNDGEGVNDTGNQHVFQSLQYLRKLVNHPLLVVKPELPGHQALLSRMSGQVDLHDISHAPKLIALRFVSISFVHEMSKNNLVLVLVKFFKIAVLAR